MSSEKRKALVRVLCRELRRGLEEDDWEGFGDRLQSVTTAVLVAGNVAYNEDPEENFPADFEDELDVMGTGSAISGELWADLRRAGLVSQRAGYCQRHDREAPALSVVA